MQQKNILIIEDNPEYQLFLRALIQNHKQVGSIESVESLDQARTVLSKKNINLILLDIGLGLENGFDFCTELKTNPVYENIPIVFLTAKQEIQDKLLGFSIGAEDYIIKTTDPLEIQARIQSILKRIILQSQASSKEGIFISRGNFQIDLSSQKVFITAGQNSENSKPQELSDLTPTEFKILSFLVRNEGQIFSRQHLLDEIWGQSLSVTGRTVDTHVHSLRKKLGVQSAKIESVFGAGYRFNSASASL